MTRGWWRSWNRIEGIGAAHSSLEEVSGVGVTGWIPLGTPVARRKPGGPQEKGVNERQMVPPAPVP
ncbi:hypothetical protein GCM10010103_68230 [Streptomyces paradoxus]